MSRDKRIRELTLQQNSYYSMLHAAAVSLDVARSSGADADEMSYQVDRVVALGRKASDVADSLIDALCEEDR